MKIEQTECSETSAYKIQTPGNDPEESIQQEAKSFRGGKDGKNCMCFGFQIRFIVSDCILSF